MLQDPRYILLVGLATTTGIKEPSSGFNCVCLWGVSRQGKKKQFSLFYSEKRRITASNYFGWYMKVNQGGGLETIALKIQLQPPSQ